MRYADKLVIFLTLYLLLKRLVFLHITQSHRHNYLLGDFKCIVYPLWTWTKQAQIIIMNCTIYCLHNVILTLHYTPDKRQWNNQTINCAVLLFVSVLLKTRKVDRFMEQLRDITQSPTNFLPIISQWWCCLNETSRAVGGEAFYDVPTSLKVLAERAVLDVPAANHDGNPVLPGLVDSERTPHQVDVCWLVTRKLHSSCHQDSLLDDLYQNTITVWHWVWTSILLEELSTGKKWTIYYWRNWQMNKWLKG